VKNYNPYQLEDFILDESFTAWVKKPTPELDDYWHNWQAENPGQIGVMEEARFFLQQLSVREEKPTDEYIAATIQQTIKRASVTDIPVQGSYGRHWITTSWQVAASLLLISGLSWAIWRYSSWFNPQNYSVRVLAPANQVTELTNRSTRPMDIVLSDGSHVSLAVGSHLVYPKRFGSSRNVKLTGEAFFNVKRQPNHPFLVHTTSITVRVLGTSFSVQAFAHDNQAKVVVKSGSVAVMKTGSSSASTLPSVLLTPNQQVIFSQENEVFRKSLADAPVLVNTQVKEADFAYTESPVGQVFDALEKAYGIDIVYNKEALKYCTLTAHLTDETMYEKLNLICQAIDATHEMVGTQIIIHAKGCQPEH
jgi:ferric-dicitrate binding protein FerR (iron transport regulator)